MKLLMMKRKRPERPGTYLGVLVGLGVILIVNLILVILIGLVLDGGGWLAKILACEKMLLWD